MYIVDLLNTKFNSTQRDYNYKIQMKLRVLSLNMNKEQQVYTPFIDILSIKKKTGLLMWKKDVWILKTFTLFPYLLQINYVQ